jgi:hypothetical protein
MAYTKNKPGEIEPGLISSAIIRRGKFTSQHPSVISNTPEPPPGRVSPFLVDDLFANYTRFCFDFVMLNAEMAYKYKILVSVQARAAKRKKKEGRSPLFL